MSKKSRFKDFLLVVCLVGVVAGVSHFVITNPLGPSRLLYYAQVPIIQWDTRCTENAPEWMERVMHHATSKMAAPASQLAFIAPDGTLNHCETGWKDKILGDEPLQATTRFRYASTTKTVTAIAVIDLVNAGLLSLDDKIIQVLGLEQDLNDPRVADITIGHLLSHRGGWDRVRTQDAMFKLDHKPWCPGNPDQLTKTGLLYDPGQKESYSNLGYCLLGLAIEHVTGKPYRQHMAGEYGFENTTLRYIDGPYLPDEVAYDTRHENFYTINYYKSFDFDALSSSAGLSGNAIDLARLIKSSLDRGAITILDGDMDGGCDPAVAQECYGYGVFRFQPDNAGEPLYMHGGKLPGAASVAAITPSGGVMVWLGAGARRPGSNALQEFYEFIYRAVVKSG